MKHNQKCLIQRFGILHTGACQGRCFYYSQLYCSSSSWNVAINGDLGTDKRIREKIERMKRFAKEAGCKEYNSQQLLHGGQGFRKVASNDSQTPHQVRQIDEERVVQEI